MILRDEAAARDFCATQTDQAGLARLDRLAALLRAENREQNLIAKVTEGILWLRHFADSAQLLTHVPRETGVWLDLGTGAGFPGLVIAALRPDTPVILVESRRRRADWLMRVIKDLALPHARVEAQRLEKVESLPAGVISARAFAPLDKLVQLSGRFSTRDTTWLLPKGRSARQEVAALPEKVSALFHVEQSLTDDEAGIIVGKGRPEVA
jgi:16S rRNA (guanine527-N7)-methyltransferase